MLLFRKTTRKRLGRNYIRNRERRLASPGRGSALQRGMLSATRKTHLLLRNIA
jgi:hypothetical protein